MMTLMLSVLVAAAPPQVSMPEWSVLGADAEHVVMWRERMKDQLRRQELSVDDVEVAVARVEVTLEQLPDGSFRGQARMVSEPAGQTLALTTLDAKDEPGLNEAIDTAASMLAAPLVDQPELPPARPPRKVAVTPYWWTVALSGFVVGGTGSVLLGTALRNVGATATSTSVFDAASKTQGPLFVSGWVCIGAGVATLVTGIVLSAPLKDYRPEVAIGPNGASIGLSGRF